ncbi:hypothetical protein AbraIFM66951_001357 [Aspergillus brasiliensis]|uniref:Uncharacterized protein n=1 Tax=Aspergillus brasiliensis TaxID=319629 RepID=A0A9W5YX10_9EURO|nr:hypothetical protein AbraCBS73388_001227 [Aspergillus brasiliensis]GKZ49100.1 hypothetical protein AbraIFM66951_001357 [Aspergillus brasiliensis]
MSSIPPPPPSPAPNPSPTQAQPPTIPPTGPKNALLLELHIFNGHPFKDHWAYWISSATDPLIGVKIHATGDVRNGFIFEIKRSHDLRTSPDVPTKRIPLQWVDGRYLDQEAMWNGGVEKIDNVPVCRFEEVLFKVKVPGKSLNSVVTTTTTSSREGGLAVEAGRKVVQRDCQTWIVEATSQLVREEIVAKEVEEFVCAIRQ